LHQLLGTIERRARVEAATEEVTERLLTYGRHLEQKCEKQVEALVHADCLSSIGQDTAKIAHELNNPMTFISGNIQIMDRFLDELMTMFPKIEGISDIEQERFEFIQGEIPKMMKSMKTGVQRLTGLLSEITNSARKSERKQLHTDLAEIVDYATQVSLARKREDITLHLDLTEGVLEVNVDPGRIEQVITNLLINAFDATQEIENAEVTLSTKRAGGSVIVTVEDNGPGISREDIQSIFEPFFSTKEPGKGTGLGLYVSKEIAKAHGGMLEASSSPQLGGARFSLTLPFADAEERFQSNSIGDEQISDTGNDSRIRFLIAEDDPANQCVLKAHLKDFGECEVVSNGQKCLEAVENAWEENAPYDLLFLDIHMPILSGMDVLREIRQREIERGVHGLSGMKIVVVSSDDLSKTILGAFRTGCEAYHVKPIQRERLFQELHKLGISKKGATHYC
jgi:signal transduction histidine kinase/CheY-like chemotaxis protein